MCLFVITCFVMLPLPLQGIPLGADLTQHLQFASTFQHAILSGDFFPGWAASDNHGFGSIGIRFYPPLAYYLMGLTQIVIENWYDTFWLNAFFWMFIGTVGMFLWAKEWLSPIQAILVATIFAFAPYHRFQIYHFILFAEFAAMGILPFCFWLVTRLIKRGTAKDFILFSVSFALLILAHIPTTILGSIGLGIYSLCLLDWKKSTVIKLLIASSLSILATSFYWLRLATEMSWVKHTADNYSVNFYDYKQHFFPMAVEQNNSMPPLDSANIFLMLCLIPLGIYLTLKFKSSSADDKWERKIILALTVSAVFCLFMTTYPSVFIWENFSFLQKVQFPWRWMSVASIIVSFAFIFGASRLFQIIQTAKPALLYPAILLFLPILFYFFAQTINPSITLNREDFAKHINSIEERKGCECWRPNWSGNQSFDNKNKVTAEAREVEIIKWNSESREFKISAGASQNVRIATYFYPHWKAEVNNKSVQIDKSADGSILIPVGETESVVKLNFQEPLMLQLALAISLLTWLSILTAGFFIYFRNQKIQ